VTTTAPPGSPSPEEQRSEKYLTLMEHLQELRYRVIMASVGVVIGLCISAYFGEDIIEFLIEPAQEARPDFQLVFLDPFESFVTYFRVALLGGLIIGMPMIVYHALKFIGPGLSPGERRWLYGTTAGATLLFISGVAFAYYIALPPAMDFLLNFGDSYAEPAIRVGSYIDFVTRLLFWTGVAFQTPLVIMYLARFGLVSGTQLIKWWRFAIVGAFVISAIVTPTIDPVTQTFVAGPIIVLYVVGIGLAFIVQPKAQTKSD
jgi:sec-independent protein translocase protein TatC